MKRIFLIILSLILVFPAAIAETLIDWSQYTEDEINAIIDEAYEELDKRADGGYGASLAEDQQSASSLDEEIVGLLEEKKSISEYSSIDSVTVNANYGTAKDGDYVALVYLTYTADYGAHTDASFIVSISDTVGEVIEENYPSINELTVFWDLPKYNSNAKASFVLKDDRMAFENIVWPKELNSAWY